MRVEADRDIEGKLNGAKRILDVGGAANVSRHATHVLDMLSYDWWQAWPQKGTKTISPENWIVHDLCSAHPFPFPDKYFDFVICSHTLEDLRDPIRVCEEMSRVGKAGYVETPSPLSELTWGRDNAPWVGYCHHRWLVSADGGALVFRMKPHLIHSSSRFYFPAGFAKILKKQGGEYTSYLWSDAIACREDLGFLANRKSIEDYIENIVRTESGENLSMLYNRVKRYIWELGVASMDRLGIRKTLRSFFVRLRG